MRIGLPCFVVAAIVAGAVHANAAIITFDDLTTRNSFFDLGIQGSYQGFNWGYSNSGISGAVVPTTSGTGWASATVGSPAVGPAPTPVSGNSYAWTYNGAQSLIVDFLAPHDVVGAYFAKLSSAYSSNSSTIQMFGYDGANNLLATSGVLNLSNSFQQLNAGFLGVTKLEIRSDSNNSWFSVDNLDVGAGNGAVPEPTSLIIWSLLGIAGSLAYRRHRKAH